MKKNILSNGVMMPPVVMGTSIDDRKGNRNCLIREMCSLVEFAIENGITAFDTARDYGNESILGKIFFDLFKSGSITREDIFITTKIGNEQQKLLDMRKQLEISLKSLKTDYIDLWLLHWPLPDYYLKNWKQLCDIYNEGVVRAIGISNVRERHLDLVLNDSSIIPHVVQIEYHPFRTVSSLRNICKCHNIQIEAYSANCVMLPFVKNNEVLNKIANKYGKTVAQIIMRWHFQQGSIPIFSSMNKKHLIDNVNIFDFELNDLEMKKIFSLDCDYKFHPESVNCPGY